MEICLPRRHAELPHGLRKGVEIMADRDENRYEQPPQDQNVSSYGQDRQQPDDNGCTYHSGRVSDWNRDERTGSQNPYQNNS